MSGQSRVVKVRKIKERRSRALGARVQGRREEPIRRETELPMMGTEL